jgi:type IV pilus assembly protein PilM
VNLDYQILDPGTGPDATGTPEVLLVAAKKGKIADYTGVITQAGRVPVVVDVDAFALQNAYDELRAGCRRDRRPAQRRRERDQHQHSERGAVAVHPRRSMGGNVHGAVRRLNLTYGNAEMARRGEPVEASRSTRCGRCSMP